MTKIQHMVLIILPAELHTHVHVLTISDNIDCDKSPHWL